MRSPFVMDIWRDKRSGGVKTGMSNSLIIRYNTENRNNTKNGKSIMYGKNITGGQKKSGRNDIFRPDIRRLWMVVPFENQYSAFEETSKYGQEDRIIDIVNDDSKGGI